MKVLPGTSEGMPGWLVLVLIWLVSSSSLIALDDFYSWHSMKWKQFAWDRSALTFAPEFRVNDLDLDTHMLKLTYQYDIKLDARFTSGVAFTYLRDDRKDPGHTRYRFESHLTGTFRLNETWGVKTRVRLDRSHREDWGYGFMLTRGLIGFSRKVDGPWGLNKISFGGEVFYDFRHDNLFQHRVKPLGLTFQLTERIQAEYYTMVWSRRNRSKGPWVHDFVIGQTYKF